MTQNATQRFYDRISHAYDLIADGGEHKARERELLLLDVQPVGRLGVVSMATTEDGDQESVLERTYVWMHTHFQHIVDCQPIPLEKLASTAGFVFKKHERIKLFTMPVVIVVAT